MTGRPFKANPKRVQEVREKRRGPCVICGSLDGRPQRITDAHDFTENNVLSFCPGCVAQMREPRSPALDRLREIVHNDDESLVSLDGLIGEDVDWLYENGRRAS